MAARTIPIKERIEKFTTRDGPPFEDKGPCWVWTGGMRKAGYGAMQVDKQSTTAHVEAYRVYVGPIPVGLQLDHLCRNRACCNPKHLEPVTRKENLLRGNGMAARNARKTHCSIGHPLSGDNLRINKAGARICLACYRARSKEVAARRVRDGYWIKRRQMSPGGS